MKAIELAPDGMWWKWAAKQLGVSIGADPLLGLRTALPRCIPRTETRSGDG